MDIPKLVADSDVVVSGLLHATRENEQVFPGAPSEMPKTGAMFAIDVDQLFKGNLIQGSHKVLILGGARAIYRDFKEYGLFFLRKSGASFVFTSHDFEATPVAPAMFRSPAAPPTILGAIACREATLFLMRSPIVSMPSLGLTTGNPEPVLTLDGRRTQEPRFKQLADSVRFSGFEGLKSMPYSGAKPCLEQVIQTNPPDLGRLWAIMIEI